MKVFISSVHSGYERERAATIEAIETLGHTVVRAEDFTASTTSPRVACLQAVRGSDCMVLILGKRYGSVQATGRSPTHEEFLEAKGEIEVLAFVEEVDEREPQQDTFVEEVQDWLGGHLTKRFCDPDNLRRHVTKALHLLQLESVRGMPDAAEIISRAVALLPRQSKQFHGQRPSLATAIAGGPPQSLIRPSELRNQDFISQVQKTSLHGTNAILNIEKGTETKFHQGCLVLDQTTSSISITTDGSVLVRPQMPITSNMMAIIEEDVEELLRRSLSLASQLIDITDPTEKLTDFGIACLVCDADSRGWRTRHEDQQNPKSMRINMHGEHAPVTLSSTTRKRGDLRTKTGEMAEDLVVLMREEFDSRPVA